MTFEDCFRVFVASGLDTLVGLVLLVHHRAAVWFINLAFGG